MFVIAGNWIWFGENLLWISIAHRNEFTLQFLFAHFVFKRTFIDITIKSSGFEECAPISDWRSCCIGIVSNHFYLCTCLFWKCTKTLACLSHFDWPVNMQVLIVVYLAPPAEVFIIPIFTFRLCWHHKRRSSLDDDIVSTISIYAIFISQNARCNWAVLFIIVFE